MNDFYKFLNATQDFITTDTAQRMAKDLGIVLDFDLVV